MRHFSGSISLTRVFQTQLAAYAAYHRDPGNCITHLIGIPMLFLAVITPLQALRIPLHHHYIPLAVALTLPAMALWLMLDLGVGAMLVLSLCPLFVIAARIAQHGGRGDVGHHVSAVCRRLDLPAGRPFHLRGSQAGFRQ